jgi:hypothetical protein
MTTMYTFLVYPLDIFGSPNNYLKVKMVQTCSWGNENIFPETYITVSISLLKHYIYSNMTLSFQYIDICHTNIF